MQNRKTAILLGATGLTGSYLLKILLDSPKYEKVKVFTRRSTNIKHNKLEEIICDLTKLEEYKKDFFANDVFCTIGTTKAKTPNKDGYYKIDYGIPTKAAKLSSENNVETFSVVSAIGANKNSKVFYSRTKGEMEEKVLSYNIPNILIHRPSLIIGKRKDNRIGEKVGYIFTKILKIFLVGKLKKYRYISGEKLAQNVYEKAQNMKGKQIIYQY